MMERLSKAVACWLLKQGAISEDEEELYEYAIFSFFLLIAPVVLAMMLGAFFCPCIYRIMLVLPFMAIRRYGGGYHTKKLISCLFLSSALLIGCFRLADYVTLDNLFHTVVLMSCASISIVSPVDSKKRELTREDVKKFRNKSRDRVLLMLAIYVTLVWKEKDEFAIYWGIGIILTAGLQIPYIILCFRPKLFVLCRFVHDILKG